MSEERGRKEWCVSCKMSVHITGDDEMEGDEDLREGGACFVSRALCLSTLRERVGRWSSVLCSVVLSAVFALSFSLLPVGCFCGRWCACGLGSVVVFRHPHERAASAQVVAQFDATTQLYNILLAQRGCMFRAQTSITELNFPQRVSDRIATLVRTTAWLMLFKGQATASSQER